MCRMHLRVQRRQFRWLNQRCLDVTAAFAVARSLTLVRFPLVGRAPRTFRSRVFPEFRKYNIFILLIDEISPHGERILRQKSLYN